MTTDPKALIIARTNEAWNKAVELFPKLSNCPRPTIAFFTKGRAAGLAYGYHKLEFNLHLFECDPNDMLNDTIPHEVAHAVCTYLRIGWGHDKTWKRVCILLGGSGRRCYTRTDTYKPILARTRKRYVHIATCGLKIELSDVIHRKLIEEGCTRVVRRTGGKVSASTFTGEIVT